MFALIPSFPKLSDSGLISLNVRLSCSRCDKTFADPSSLSVHRKKFHAAVTGNANAASTAADAGPDTYAPLLWVNAPCELSGIFLHLDDVQTEFFANRQSKSK